MATKLNAKEAARLAHTEPQHRAGGHKPMAAQASLISTVDEPLTGGQQAAAGGGGKRQALLAKMKSKREASRAASAQQALPGEQMQQEYYEASDRAEQQHRCVPPPPLSPLYFERAIAYIVHPPSPGTPTHIVSPAARASSPCPPPSSCLQGRHAIQWRAGQGHEWWARAAQAAGRGAVTGAPWANEGGRQQEEDERVQGAGEACREAKQEG